MSTLKGLLKRLDQLTAAFRISQQQQQTRTATNQLLTARDLNNPNSTSTSSSPSSASFSYLLGQVRDERDLQRARRTLEPILERLLCGSLQNVSGSNSGSSGDPSLSSVLATIPTLVNAPLKDKYKLAAAFKSPRLLQRLMDADLENAAYLLDLKQLKKL